MIEEESKVLYEYVMGNAVEKNGEALEKTFGYGYLKKRGSTYIPDVVTIKMDEVRIAVQNMDSSVLSELSVLAERAKTLLKNLYDEFFSIVCTDLPPVLIGN